MWKLSRITAHISNNKTETKCAWDVFINPFTLRAAKTGLTTLEIFYLEKYYLENI